MKLESLNTITARMNLLNDQLACLLSNVRLVAYACKPLSDELIEEPFRDLTDGENVLLELYDTLRGLYESGLRLQEDYVYVRFTVEELIADTINGENNQ